MTTRRKVLATLAVAALAMPIRVAGQQGSRIYRVGFLSAGFRDQNSASLLNAFVQRLRDLGYSEGNNLAIEWRFADGDNQRLPSLVVELARMKVDLIITNSTVGTVAAQRATTTIPIVFSGVQDAVGEGIVKNLARPEGNATGLSLLMTDLTAKHVEILASIVPKLSRIAFIGASATLKANLDVAQDAAQKIGAKVLPLIATNPEEIEQAFKKMGDLGSQAVIVISGPALYAQRNLIAQLAIKNRIASIAFFTAEAEAGYLCSYGQDREDNYRKTADYVAKILKGVSPKELPVEQPTVFPLVVNLKTAKALGIKIPPMVLMRADRVIE